MIHLSQAKKAATNDIILPGSTIGILGGGQLGRMIILEGRKMGYRFVVLDPTPNSPAGQVADQQLIAPYSDQEAGERLAALSDVILYEFENVDVEVVRYLESQTFLPQGSWLLKISQNRIQEKNALVEIGVPVAPYQEVRSMTELHQAAEILGYPCVLKNTMGGYDGRGQRIIHSKQEIGAVGEELFSYGEQYVLESYIPFTMELSVVVARNSMGEIRTFPVAENIHRRHILHQSIVPARIESAVAKEAEKIARKIAEDWAVVGLVAVEMFLLPTGELIVNEIAPRPHNSGHYTFDACKTSQFEQMIRAVCGLPLGSTQLLSEVLMVNVLGEHLPLLMKKLPTLTTDTKLHLYGKEEAKEGRKMGHITLLTDSVDEALTQFEQLNIWKSE